MEQKIESNQIDYDYINLLKDIQQIKEQIIPTILHFK